MPDPIPRWLRWCAWSFLPIEQRPSPCGNRVGAPRYPFNRFRREPNFGAAGFVSVLLASTLACRTDGSDLRDARGRRGVYIPAEHGLLPHHAWDMLITRIDQLVMGRLALPQLLSLVGCSSRSGFRAEGGRFLNKGGRQMRSHPPQTAPMHSGASGIGR